jgi:hypothetical protein
MANETLEMTSIVRQILSQSRHSFYFFFCYPTINAVTAIHDKTNIQIYVNITVYNIKYIILFLLRSLSANYYYYLLNISLK